MFRGIRILERMTKLFNDQGDKAIFSLAEWIEELEEKNERLTKDEAIIMASVKRSKAETIEYYNKYIDSSKDNCELRREIEADNVQIARLLFKIDRLEMYGYSNED